MRPIFFTKEKLESIKREYSDLKEKRKEAVVSLQKAREMGDLSENGYYKAAKSNLFSIDYNLRRLAGFIKDSFVIKTNNRGVVELDSKFTLVSNGKEEKFHLVGKFESNPRIGKISNESPLGISLFGKRAGDKVIVETPGGKINYKIVKIS